MKTKKKLFAVFATLLFLALANKASADGVCEWTKKDSSTGEITTGRAVLTADLLARTTNETSGIVDESSCKSYIEHLRDEDAHTNTFTFTRFIENAKQANDTTTPTTTGTTTGTFSYQLLEAIPGIFSQGATPDFNAYVSGIYKFLILVVGICALFMITIGGYMYITSAGNTASMGKARSIIFDAIIGLVLALLAYLIFYTINPNLTSPTGLQPISGVVSNIISSTGTGRIISGGNIASDSRAPEIPVTSTKKCTDPNVSGCTYTAGLPNNTISTIKTINEKYPIVISGAAETAGHTSHGQGKPMVDIQPRNGNYDELGSYLKANASTLGIKQICTTYEKRAYRLNCDYNETADHFHITGV